MLRKAGERTVSGRRGLIGKLVDIFRPAEWSHYFSSCGYDPDWSKTALNARVILALPSTANATLATPPTIPKAPPSMTSRSALIRFYALNLRR